MVPVLPLRGGGVAIMVVAALAAVAWLLVRAPAPRTVAGPMVLMPVTVTVPRWIPTPMAVAVPVPEPDPVMTPAVARGVAGPCPARPMADRKIGPKVDVDVLDQEWGDLVDVAAAAAAPVLAVWTETEVRVSRDDGATWRVVLATGTGEIDGVVVDCVGNVAVARGGRLGIAAIGRDGAPGAERWLEAPPRPDDDPDCDADAPSDRAFVGGRWILWQACGYLVATGDLGVTWTQLGHADALGIRDVTLIGELDGTFRGSERVHDMCGLDELRTYELSGPQGTSSYAIENNPIDASTQDALGRPLAIRGGHLVRHSERHGWRQLRADRPRAD